MTRVAVVVTYNRRTLLEACLSGLSSQTLGLDEVLVVDNASTDGTAELLSRTQGISIVTLQRNSGGAGGFAAGVEYAIAKGHEWAWLMDDDACPTPTALEELVKTEKLYSTAGLYNSEPIAFLASMPVDSDLIPLEGHLPAPDDAGQRQVAAAVCGSVAVRRASFVGVMINLNVARRTALPYAEFFIWNDDVEYTSRLVRGGIGLYVPTSRIQHPNGSSVRDLGSMVYFAVRNNIWLLRFSVDRGLPLKLEYSRRILRVIARQATRSSDKKVYATSTARAIRDGLFSAPIPKLPQTKVQDRASNR